MGLPPFSSRSLSPIVNLTNEFAVNINTEPLSYVLPANYNATRWNMSFWFVPDWANTDGLRHFITHIFLNDDNQISIEKDAAGDITASIVAAGDARSISLTVPFLSGDPIFVGLSWDGNPAFSGNARNYLTLYADTDGDGILERVDDGKFHFDTPIPDFAAGTYTLHLGTDREGAFGLDGAVNGCVLNEANDLSIFDRYGAGDGLALTGEDSWIARWCEFLVLCISAEASGNVRADSREGALDLMDVADDGKGRLVFEQNDKDWVDFGDTQIFDGITAGTFFFDHKNTNAAQGKILCGRFRLSGNANRQWLVSHDGQGAFEFQINTDPSPGGESGALRTFIRYAKLNQRIVTVFRFDGSEPDDFGVNGKLRMWWSWYNDDIRAWASLKEVPTSDISNPGLDPIPAIFKTGQSATSLAWSSFDDQQVSMMDGDYNECRFNIGRALDPEEIEAMSPDEFVRSQWTHRWSMALNEAGTFVVEDLGSGLDGELKTDTGDGPDEVSDGRFRRGRFNAGVKETGVYAFDGVADKLLSGDPGDVADIELTRLSLPGDGSPSGGNLARTAHDSAFDVLTGDLDLRMDLRRDSYRDGPTQFSQQLLMGKLDGGPGDRTFVWDFSSFGTFVATLYRSEAPAGNEFGFAIFEFMPAKLDGRRIWIRFTCVLDDGLGNRVGTFYYSETWDGVSADDGETWIVVGVDTDAGAIQGLDASPGSAMEIGASATNTFRRLRADVFRAQVRDGIDGTIVWDPNFEAEAPGTTSFTEDANGLTVTLTQVGDPHAQITNGLQRVSWAVWLRVASVAAGVETIFGRWDGADNQFRIARNGADLRVYISSGGASEADFADFVIGMKANERWKFVVVYVGSGPYAYPQLDLPKGIRVTLYAYLFDEATGQYRSAQEIAASYTGTLPQQLVPSALGYVFADGEFGGEIDEVRVWNDVELTSKEADTETIYRTLKAGLNHRWTMDAEVETSVAGELATKDIRPASLDAIVIGAEQAADQRQPIGFIRDGIGEIERARGSHLALDGSAGAYASIANTSLLDITDSEMEVWIDLAPLEANGGPGGETYISRWKESGNERSWRIRIGGGGGGGSIGLTTSATGDTLGVGSSAQPQLFMFHPDTLRIKFRSHWDVRVGPSPPEVDLRFWYRLSDLNPWINMLQHHGNGTSPLFNSQADLDIGRQDPSAAEGEENYNGEFYSVRIWDGIPERGGIEIVNIDFTNLLPGTTSFEEQAQGLTVNLFGTAEIKAGNGTQLGDFRYRLHALNDHHPLLLRTEANIELLRGRLNIIKSTSRGVPTSSGPSRIDPAWDTDLRVPILKSLTTEQYATAIRNATGEAGLIQLESQGFSEGYFDDLRLLVLERVAPVRERIIHV